jgi:hypothetical protein
VLKDGKPVEDTGGLRPAAGSAYFAEATTIWST